jgi:hypothetical protein
LIALISNAHPYRRAARNPLRKCVWPADVGRMVITVERPEVIEINPSSRRGQASVDPCGLNRRTLMSTSS